MAEPLTIAIDYDDTWTAAPDLWSAFARLACEQGHRVVCITARMGRPQDIDEVREALPGFLREIYFSGIEPKEEYARRNGIVVNVWIDDMPGWIVGVT